MLRNLMISTAAVALLAGSAMAQSTNNSPSTNNAPSTQMNDSKTSSAKFIAQQDPNQWVFSKFKGTDVLGPQDEHIGDVNDLLFDKEGKIHGVVIGVGGFLGIGSKNVAIDMSAFQVVPASTGSSSSSSSSSNNDPTDVKLKVSWTKEQLKDAPDFQYYKAPSNAASSGSSTTGMAPRSNTSPAAPR